MALSTEDKEKLEETFREKLKEQYNRGLKVGVLATSKIVLDKLNQTSKPYAKRVEDVKEFCRKPLRKYKEENPESDEV